jgi:hypothetical protein
VLEVPACHVTIIVGAQAPLSIDSSDNEHRHHTHGTLPFAQPLMD